MLIKRTTRADGAIGVSFSEIAMMDKIAWRSHTVRSVSIEIQPMPARSTNRDDYQRVPRPVAAMAKDFPNGFVIAPHSHPRAQLVYAADGVMRVISPLGAWVVPPVRAAGSA